MSRFIDNKDGTVTDTSTNLMWQQGKGKRFTFEEARKYAASLTLAGYNNWRLPTIEELRSIVDQAKSNPAINSIFECHSSSYWSGTTVVDYPNDAYFVYFYYGDDNWFDKFNYNYVRCVRDFKKE